MERIEGLDEAKVEAERIIAELEVDIPNIRDILFDMSVYR